MPPSADSYPLSRNSSRRSSASTQPSKYDLRLNPPYQVDFCNVAAGKTIAATKRRVRFRFGFSNRLALEEGRSGTDCRGEEHEVVIVVSTLSGKRYVYCDGHEVHFSTGSGSFYGGGDNVFETSWTMKGGHLVKVKGYTSLNLMEDSRFRQFDLFIDGLSYFAMPKIYELGKKSVAGVGRGSTRALPPPPPPPRSVSPAPVEEEEEHYGFQYRRSTPERRSIASSGRAVTEIASDASLDEKKDESAVVDILSDASVSNSSDLLDIVSSGVAAPSSPLQLDNTPTPSSGIDEFAPVATPPSSSENQFASVSHSILSQYGNAATVAAARPAYSPGGGVLALANESHTYSVPNEQQHHQYSAYHHHQQQQHSHPGYPSPYPPPPYTQQPSYYTTTPASSYAHPVSPDASMRSLATVDEASAAAVAAVPLSMQPLSLEDLVIAEEEKAASRPLTDVERAVASLVNLGDIKEAVVTPEQRKSMQAKESQIKAAKKSKPAPPSAPGWRMGQGSTLGDLQRAPKTSSASSEPKKEIMRTHAFDANAVHAGMMVVYGSAPAPPNGAEGGGMVPMPSMMSGGGIPHPQGFGAGAVYHYPAAAGPPHHAYPMSPGYAAY
jgi:hypothetical protein